MCNLDALHDHLATRYLGMKAPSFRTTERDDGGLNLHYYSDRACLSYIVVGIVKTIAKENLNTIIDIKIEKEKDDNNDHVIFAIHERSGDSKLGSLLSTKLLLNYNSCPHTGVRTKSGRKNPFMTVSSFAKAFPFHVVFDRNLHLRQCGAVVSKYIDKSAIWIQQHRGTQSVTKLSFLDVFEVIRPKINFTFDSVLAHIYTVFVVSARHSSNNTDTDTVTKTSESFLSQDVISKLPTENESPVAFSCPFSTASASLTGLPSPIQSRHSNKEDLKLKGQMIYLPKTDCVLFLCTLRVDNLEELQKRDLYLSDVPAHDAARELILASQARKDDMEIVKRLEESTNGLKILKSKLVHHKNITDDLLHELLPKDVAAQLRLNKTVPAERYPVVSVIFSDLVGFTEFCSNESVIPMDIITLLNTLYTTFDTISSRHEVYKVWKHSLLLNNYNVFVLFSYVLFSV